MNIEPLSEEALRELEKQIAFHKHCVCDKDMMPIGHVRALLAEVRRHRDAAKAEVEATPQWIVNDLGELGVLVGSRFFFLYKGDNLEYGIFASKSGIALHDDGTPMKYRPVGKREFGEVCYPFAFKIKNQYPPQPYTEGDEWKPLPTPASAEGAQAQEREHELKVWPEFYEKLLSGEKTFEIRLDDRGYRRGDWLRLREFVMTGDVGRYTGRVMRREVTYLMGGGMFGLAKGYVAMALAPLPDAVPPEVVTAPAPSVPAATPAATVFQAIEKRRHESEQGANDIDECDAEARCCYRGEVVALGWVADLLSASLATAPAPRTYAEGFADAREMAARLVFRASEAGLAQCIRALKPGGES